jgi:hypothetical protein
MAQRLKRVTFTRIAVGLAVLVFPLVAAGTASAAIAGANPFQTPAATGTPDLLSATIEGSSNIEYCFDHTLAATYTKSNGTFAARFTAGGYAASNVVESTATGPYPIVDHSSSTSENCVIAAFKSSEDIADDTIAGVAAGAVEGNQSLEVNNADNTTLLGSISKSGLPLYTTGPDLLSAVVNTNANQITYQFDQPIGTYIGTGPLAGYLYYVDGGDNTCYPTKATISGSTIVATYNSGGCTDVNNAVRAGIVYGAVDSANIESEDAPNPDDSTIVSGGGTTSAPDLVSTKIVDGGAYVDFVFDKPVANADSGDFYVGLSNGAQVGASSTTIIGGDTVQATFTVLSVSFDEFDEYAVIGDVSPEAVTGANSPFDFNAADSTSLGTNPGSNSEGFTTGSDAESVSFDSTDGTATVQLDQRSLLDASGFGIGGFVLLGVDGQPVDAGVPAQSASFGDGGSLAAGPETVTLNFTPDQIMAARGLEIEPCSMITFGAVPFLFDGFNIGDACNVQQILAPLPTASILSHGVFRAHKLVKRSAAVKRASLRKAERFVLRLKAEHKLAHHL